MGDIDAIFKAYDIRGLAPEELDDAAAVILARDIAREIEQEPNMPLAHLAREFNARGPAYNCLTACAASTQAIGEAFSIIRRGDADDEDNDDDDIGSLHFFACLLVEAVTISAASAVGANRAITTNLSPHFRCRDKIQIAFGAVFSTFRPVPYRFHFLGLTGAKQVACLVHGASQS